MNHLSFDKLPQAVSDLHESVKKIETLLLTQKKESKSLEETLLTVKEAAEFLSLTVPTIYGLIHKGELPVMKRSKRCYFSKEDLFNYIKKGRIKTIDEIKTESSAFDSKKGHPKGFLKKGVYHA